MTPFGRWPHSHRNLSPILNPEVDKVQDLHEEHEHLPRPRGIAADGDPSDLYDYYMTQLDRWQDRRFPKVRG